MDDAPSKLDLSTFKGLSEDDAARRLLAGGYNELPTNENRTFLKLIWNVVREPMFMLLLACGVVYLLLGEPREAVMLLGFVFVVMGITLYQERKTERALEALRDLSSPRALVIRGGERRRIPGREVVQDDLVLVAEGDRVPADGVLLWSSNVSADESLLTGESVPVRKVTWDHKREIDRPGGDDLPFVYSGSLIVHGQGVAKILKTGHRTEMGKIGIALQNVGMEETLLQKEVERLVRNVAILGAGLCAVVIIAYGVIEGNWLRGLLSGITLAMAMLPEEFPVVLTIFLALGAWRLSKKQVLTRRVPAIETLGAATVLCVDKTGTLTMNQMEIHQLVTDSESFNLSVGGGGEFPEAFHELVEFGILASQRDPFDPMEKAFHALGARYLAETEHLHSDWKLVREYALSPELLALSHVWASPTGDEYVIAAKGAPEAIADLCHLSDVEVAKNNDQVSKLAAVGLRVLGICKGVYRKRELPGNQHDFDFKFLGLVGLADPLRPTVASAVQECYSAGIRVVMITGDHPVTAQSIARQIGLIPSDQVITGPELETMDDGTLRDRVKSVSIFARMIPEQKLRLVEALKANKEIVAMTGDGVNDAPALKAAHIGIAMGGRGTDVAREAASLVLLDDDFSSIVQAVRMGRRIYDHLRKAMTYVVASHVPIAGMSLLPVLFRWPLILYPVHILFLELLIDPACSIAFEAEPEESNLMQRPPRPATDRLFNRWMFALGLLQGLSVTVIVLAVFLFALYRGQGDQDARALAFCTLIIANLGLILANRSWSRTIGETMRNPNPALWWVIGGSAVLLAIVLYVPVIREMFHFSRLHANDLVLCLVCGSMSVVWFEIVKRLRLMKTN